MTAAQYDALERAIVNRSRVAIRMKSGRELLVTQNPSSGLPMLLQIDDIERLEVVQ